MTTPAEKPPAAPRNPGPGWGYPFLRFVDRFLPEVLFRPARRLGTWVAVGTLPERRRHSRDFLRVALGREPSIVEVFRHFFEFSEALMLKLRVANGRPLRGRLAPGAEVFEELVRSREPAFLGTFHFAHSDLSGFLIGGQEGMKVALVRQRVGNSHDTESLGERYAGQVSFIWVNASESPLFGIKEAIAAGKSVALKCDRLEHSAKTAAFRFLGAQRLFPVTIYHLALILGRPVLLSVAVPAGEGEIEVHSSCIWKPDTTAGREVNLRSAQAHFQGFLDRIEELIRRNPYWWFNFLPLNPEVAA